MIKCGPDDAFDFNANHRNGGSDYCRGLACASVPMIIGRSTTKRWSIRCVRCFFRRVIDENRGAWSFSLVNGQDGCNR